MTTYNKLANGDIFGGGFSLIPTSHDLYRIIKDKADIGEAEILPYIEQPIATPTIVTMRQARLALLDAGLLDSVDTVINTLDDPPKSAALIEWQYASTVERDSQFTILLAAGLGLSESEIDDLFIAAAEK